MKKIIIKDTTFAALPGTMTTHSWQIPHGLTYDEWRAAGLRLGQIKDWTNFAIGDWIEFGNAKYGETYAQAVSELDISEERLRQMKWVAARIPAPIRNNNLTWSHHYVVANLPTEKERVEWLGRAQMHKWQVRELQDELVKVGLRQKKTKTLSGDAELTDVTDHNTGQAGVVHFPRCSFMDGVRRCELEANHSGMHEISITPTVLCPVCDEAPATILVCPKCVESIHLAFDQIRNKNIHKRKGKRMARGKTEQLPGVTNGKIIKEVSDAAEEYEILKDKRVKLLAQEVEANAALVEIMRKHKLKFYRDDNYTPPLTVELAEKDATIKAKVRREKEKEDAE